MDERFTFFSVDVEISNRCDVGCRMCGREQLRRPKGLMKQATFSGIARALLPLKSRITLCGLGNPVSNPRWPDFVREYRDSGGTIGLVIHGTHLSEKIREELLEVQPSHLEISFPSVDEENFRYLSPGGSYQAAHEAVVSLAGDRSRRFPIVMVGIATQANPDEQSSSLEHWRALGLPARVFACHSRGGSISASHLTTSPVRPAPDVSCGLFAMHAFVTWEGILLSCCHDLTGQTALGDFHRDTLETLISRKVAHLGQTQPFSVCARCDDPYRMMEMPSMPFPQSERRRRKALSHLGRKMKKVLGD